MSDWAFSLYVVILITGAACLTVMALLVWRRAVLGSRQFTLWVLSAAGWAFLHALEVLAREPVIKIFWAKVQYLPMESLPVYFVLFALAYTRSNRPLAWHRMLLFWVIPLIAVGVVFTNDLHGWFWSRIRPAWGFGGATLVYEHGVAFWLVLAYNYMLILIGSLLFVRAAFRTMRIYQRQSIVLMIGIAIPWMANAFYISRPALLPGLDLTPLGFCLSGVIVGWGLFRLHFMDLVPVARDMLFEEMDNGVLVLDREERIVDLNPAARELIDLQADVVGKEAKMALPAWLEQATRDQSVDQRRVEAAVDDQSQRYLDVHISTLRDRRARPTGRLIVLQDISERKKLEKLRDDLTRAMVHDLRNPLGTVLMALDTLKHPENNTTVPVSEVVELAEYSAIKMQYLVDSILDIARLQKGQMPVENVALNVAVLVQEAIGQAKLQAHKKNIFLIDDVADDLALACGDASLTSRVMQNLIGNAVNFTPSDGRVRVSARQDIELHAIVVSVSDTGDGIPPEVQPRLFEMFAAGRSKGSGSGLGLAFCRLAVEAQHGRIWAESTPGRGATLSFMLPLSPR